MLDYTNGDGNRRFAGLIVSRAKQFYLADKDCPLAYEPSGGTSYRRASAKPI